MSGVSPSAVLFSSDGTELTVANNTVIPTGTRTILISGTSPTGAANFIPATSDGILGITQMSNHQVVQSAATVTTTGSFTTSSYFAGDQEVALVVNIGTVTGAGTIQYSIQEVDSLGTLYGNSATTVVISSGNAPGIFTATINVSTALNFKVTWTVTGTFSATITSNVQSKSTPSTQTINGTVTATNNSVGTDGAAVLGFDTQIGGSVTTAAPTYTTGNLNALSLTTKGGLRIDGVYAQGTANASAPDIGVSGGYVTTAAPTYTTGQLNPLSLDTSGNLRITGAVTTNKATTSAITSVAVSANANNALLTSNATRIFASVFNGTNKTIYIKLGTTASTSSYSVQLFTSSYWEVPNDWTGELDAFAPSGATGNILITELTP